ncbi:hypothetical protein Tco_0121525 [Tanacetum coccineum]
MDKEFITTILGEQTSFAAGYFKDLHLGASAQAILETKGRLYLLQLQRGRPHVQTIAPNQREKLMIRWYKEKVFAKSVVETKAYVGDIIVQTYPIVISLTQKRRDLNTLLKRVNSVNSSEPTLSIRPTNVEVPKELPKVSMVNTSLKKLKHHLANFDVVVKERTTPTAIIKGSWDKDKIKQDFEEIETINIELDHRVTKLIAENEHLKQTYKQLYDSIKPTRIQSKEQCAKLISQVNLKSVEISDLNASLQEKALAITALKDELRKLKGKALVDNNVSNHPSDPELHQEMLSKISKTCPSINSSGEQLVAVTPMNKVKRVRFTEPVTSSRNTKTAHTSNLASNKPMLSSTGVKQSTSDPLHPAPAPPRPPLPPRNTTSRSDEDSQTPRQYLKNKCNGCMLSDNHDLCVLDFINNVNARAKSRSVKKNSKRKVWKPTGNVFTNIGYIWRPTGRTFTIVGNAKALKLGLHNYEVVPSLEPNLL